MKGDTDWCMQCVQNVGGKNLKERNGLENVAVNWRIILKWILKERDSGVN
jgi:hypothetical protein